MWNLTGLLAALAALAAAAIAIPAAAQSPGHKAIAEKVANDYGVKLLRTTEGEIDGKSVLLITVMKEGGNSNDAFQVTTLAVDPTTGDLISQYRTTPTGQVNTGPGPLEPSSDESGETMRQQSSRPSGR